jgi:hypothetical protein
MMSCLPLAGALADLFWIEQGCPSSRTDSQQARQTHEYRDTAMSIFEGEPVFVGGPGIDDARTLIMSSFNSEVVLRVSSSMAQQTYHTLFAYLKPI